MKEIRSRRATVPSSRQKIKFGKRMFLLSMIVSMILASPWIFPQILANKIQAQTSQKSTVEETADNMFQMGDNSFQTGAESTLSNETKAVLAGLDAESSLADVSETSAFADEETESVTDASASETGSTDADASAQQEENPTESSKAEPPFSYMTVDNTYFDDALFIGDSRTVGIYEYGKINNADFFCHNGLTVYTVLKEKLPVKNFGEIKLLDLLAQKKYGKIYIALGINEIGNEFEDIMKHYNQLIVEVQKANPGSTIYLQGNIHVTAAKSASHSYITNGRINVLNSYIQGNADNITVFYLNPNEQFDDASGSLKAELSGDGVHFFAKYYVQWVDWLKTKAVIRS